MKLGPSSSLAKESCALFSPKGDPAASWAGMCPHGGSNTCVLMGDVSQGVLLGWDCPQAESIRVQQSHAVMHQA